MEDDDEDSDDDDDDEDGDDVDGGDLLRPLLPVLETWPPLLPPRPDILEPDQDYHQLHPSARKLLKARPSKQCEFAILIRVE